MIFHLSVLSYIGFSDTPDAAGIRTLISQRKTLQKSVSRLENVALKLSAEKEKGQRKQVPRDLSVSVKLHSICFYSVFILRLLSGMRINKYLKMMVSGTFQSGL